MARALSAATHFLKLWRRLHQLLRLVMPATLLDHVTPQMRIYHEESFGPVKPIALRQLSIAPTTTRLVWLQLCLGELLQGPGRLPNRFNPAFATSMVRR